jgi:hypothetical protein
MAIASNVVDAHYAVNSPRLWDQDGSRRTDSTLDAHLA